MKGDKYEYIRIQQSHFEDNIASEEKRFGANNSLSEINVKHRQNWP